jgi:D-alanine-D-alanine ligase
MSKTRVAVLRGGPSDEYEVSLRTGHAVLESIDSTRFEPIDIIITKGGEWLHEGRVRYPEHLIPIVDVVFIALHGTYGEDGTVQRLLERFGVPYTGSGPYASGLAMHKGYTKEHLKTTGIKLPQHYTVRREDGLYPRVHAGRIRELFGPSYVVKPVASGSSVGVEIVRDTLLLGEAIERVLNGYAEVLVEEFIEGREVTCGVIERFREHDLYALPSIEIIHAKQHPFFNYDAKYDGTTSEVCPAPITQSAKRAVEHASKLVHKELGLSQYSRSDFILGKDGLYFLEVNTLPGLTTESLIPNALRAVGSSHRELVTHLITDALVHA